MSLTPSGPNTAPASNAQEPARAASPNGDGVRDAVVEAELRRLLSEALAKARLETLLCEHEPRETSASEKRDLLAPVALFLTTGFFFAHLFGLEWWWWIAASVIAGVVFVSAFYGVVLIIPARAERTLFAAVFALVVIAFLFWPVTAGLQLYWFGWEATLYTHLLPLALVVPIFIALWATRRLFRLLRFVRYMPALLLATVGVLMIPLFTQELWRLAAQANPMRGFALIFGLAAGILVLTFLAWRGMSEPHLQLAGATERLAKSPDEARDEALQVLRSMVGTGDQRGILGRGVVQVAQSGVAHVGHNFRHRRPRPTAARAKTSDHNRYVGELLETSFERVLLENYAELYINPRAEDLFGRRLLLWRLLILVALLTTIAFLIFYAFSTVLVAVEIGEEWSNSDISERELLSWLGIHVDFPLGPYFWLSLTFALVATAVSLTFIVTNEARRAELMKSIGEEIRRCLLIGAPYYHLPTNDTFAGALELVGFGSTVRCDNCRNLGKEPGEPDHAGRPGDSSVWYRWSAPGGGPVEMEAMSESFDTSLAVYTGSTLTELSVVASNAGRPSRVGFQAKRGAEYRIAVDTLDAQVGSVELGWSLVPTNDAFEGPELLSGTNGSVRGHNGGATRQTDEPFHADLSGGASVWYRWTAPVDARVVFDTGGSSFDTMLAVYTGSTLASLSPVASDDDSLGRQSRLWFDATAGVDYHIAVDGFAGLGLEGTGDIVLSWAANDAFVAAAELSGAGGSIAGWNAHASKEDHEPEHDHAAGGASVWYRWTAPSDARVTFTVTGSDFDPVLAVYAGSSLDALESLANAADRPGAFSFDAHAGQTYAVAVDGRDDHKGDFRLSWAANDAFDSAAELKGPSGRVSGWNGAATREPGEPKHGTDSGAMSVWYRWTSPGAGGSTFSVVDADFAAAVIVYTGATLAELDPVQLQPSEKGSASFVTAEGETYSICVDSVRDADGKIGSGSFVLDWEFPPTNAEFASAIELKGTRGSTTGWNAGARKEEAEHDHAGNRGGSSVWYRWTAPLDGGMTITTHDSSFDTLLAVYTGSSVDGLSPVVANDDESFTSTSSSVSFGALASETYSIAVDGFDGASGEIALQWELVPPPANDDFAEAMALVGASGRLEGTNHGATRQPDEPYHAGNVGGASVWYRWSAAEDGWLRIATSGSSFDTLLAVYTGTRLDALTHIASNDDARGSHSVVAFPLRRGMEYKIAVDGFDGAAGDLVLAWEPVPSPANDAFASAEEIAGTGGTAHGETWRATREPGEPDHAGGTGGASIWYRWTAPADQRVSITTAGSSFDTVLAVYTGSSVDALTLVAENDDAGPGRTWSSVSFGTIAGEVYSIAVDGYRGAIGEVVVHLEFEVPPENDDFENAAPLAGFIGTVEGTNRGATPEPGEPEHAGNPGGASVWYRWRAPADGLVTFMTVGSTFDTLLAAYTGSELDRLTLRAENDDAPGAYWSRISFEAAADTEYVIAVDGFGGATGEISVTWDLLLP